MRRVCFRLQLDPGRIDEYRQRHAEVWPDMLEALRDTGWRNYSLFISDDGLLIGYLETDDLAAALEGMASTEVNARWQADMSSFFMRLGGAAPDTGMVELDEVFNLEDQLRRHDLPVTSA